MKHLWILAAALILAPREVPAPVLKPGEGATQETRAAQRAGAELQLGICFSRETREADDGISDAATLAVVLPYRCPVQSMTFHALSCEDNDAPCKTKAEADERRIAIESVLQARRMAR